MSKKLVFGFGINDIDYLIRPKINGKHARCPYYRTWTNMLKRCYSESCLQKQPTYRGCKVCNQWKYFSSFKRWMESQDWEGK